MSRQAPYTPCLEDGCPEYAVQASRCKTHYIPWKGSTRKKRLPRGWQQTREAILTRDKGICYLCGERGADAVDHIEPGDDHSPSNLAAVHQDIPPYCHRSKSAWEGLIAQGVKPRPENYVKGRYWPDGAPF